MSKTFPIIPITSPRCHIPWQQMVIDSTGSVNPCAYYGGYGNFNSNVGNLNEQSIEDIWNNSAFQNLRKHMARGDLVAAGCANCYALKEGLALGIDYDKTCDDEFPRTSLYAENIVVLKDEISRGSTYLKAKPTIVSYTPSHRCNLRCIQCYQTATRTAEFSRAAADEAILQLSPYLVRLIAGGGEPFLLNIWKRFLANFDNGINPYLEFATTTNATLIDPLVISGLRRFKTIAISISLDATGSLYEKIRVGASWDDVVKNVRLLKRVVESSSSERSAIAVTACVMKSSIRHLPDFVAYSIVENLPFGVSPVVTMPVDESLICFNRHPLEEIGGWLDALCEANSLVENSSAVTDQAKKSYKKRFDLIEELIASRVNSLCPHEQHVLQFPLDALQEYFSIYGSNGLIAYIFPVAQRSGTAPYWASISSAGVSSVFLPAGRWGVSISNKWNNAGPLLSMAFSTASKKSTNPPVVRVRKALTVERWALRVIYGGESFRELLPAAWAALIRRVKIF